MKKKTSWQSDKIEYLISLQLRSNCMNMGKQNTVRRYEKKVQDQKQLLLFVMAKKFDS